MLDTIFRNGSDRKQSQDELRTLLVEARNERHALRARLDQAGDAQTRLTQAHQAIDALGAKCDALTRQLEQLSSQAARQDERQQRFEQLEAQVAELAGRQAASHDLGTLVVQAGQELDARIATLTRLLDLGKDTESRLASLNALAEHVSHKARALEAQKQTIEHAVVEAARLNQMVWTMDAQIAKISEGKEQLERTEEAVERMAQLAAGTAQELAAANAAREQSLRETARLQAQGRTLADSLGQTVERLALDKQEFEAWDQRLKAMTTAVAETESRLHTVLARDEALAALQRQAQTLAGSFDSLAQRADALARQQLGLDGLADQLGRIEALGARTAAQQQGLLQSQQALDQMRQDLAEFHTRHAAAAQLRDQLALDRCTLESFVERCAGMISRTPEVEARLDAVLSQLARVDAGRLAAERLAELAATLDEQLTRVGARMQFVEQLDQRVDGLHRLTAEVERQHAEQLARRAEVEGLKNQCDSLAALVVHTRQQLDGVSVTQARLLPLGSQVEVLTQTLQGAQQQLAGLKQDDAVVREQQALLNDLLQQGRQQAAEAAARLQQVQALSSELDRAGALKQALFAELAGVQGRQHEALAQIEVADQQLQRAETLTLALEQRRTQLQVTEQAIAGFEGRLAELQCGGERVAQQIRSLAEREALVQAVRAEVDNIREISSRSRADLQFVAEHRADVSELRARIEELMGRAGETEDKIATIEAQRKTVDEVQAATRSVVGMLGDIQLNLELLGEQRAVIDHVGDQLARLDYSVQEAQNTLRALQREREVAERIEQGIKALRARSGAGT